MFTTVDSSTATHAGGIVLPAGDAVEVLLARTRMDLVAAFRLLYDSYVHAGLVSENEQKLRLTPYHLLPGTEVFVAKCRGEVIGTMTMVCDGEAGLPMDSMYGDEANQLRGFGLRLAEMGCFADRRESPARFLKMIGELSRLVVQVARSRGVQGLVAATHPRHARFYIRSLGFEQFAGLKSCPYAQGNPAVALVQQFAKLEETPIHDRLFGNPYPPEQMMRTCWDEGTRNFLRSLVTRTEPSSGQRDTASCGSPSRDG